MSFYEKSDHVGNALDEDGPQNDVDVLVKEDVKAFEQIHGRPPSEDTITGRRAFHKNLE